jgi:hypothetical protein
MYMLVSGISKHFLLGFPENWCGVYMAGSTGGHMFALVCRSIVSTCYRLCIAEFRVVRLDGGCIISCVLCRAARVLL